MIKKNLGLVMAILVLLSVFTPILTTLATVTYTNYSFDMSSGGDDAQFIENNGDFYDTQPTLFLTTGSYKSRLVFRFHNVSIASHTGIEEWGIKFYIPTSYPQPDLEEIEIFCSYEYYTEGSAPTIDSDYLDDWSKGGVYRLSSVLEGGADTQQSIYYQHPYGAYGGGNLPLYITSGTNYTIDVVLQVNFYEEQIAIDAYESGAGHSADLFIKAKDVTTPVTSTDTLVDRKNGFNIYRRAGTTLFENFNIGNGTSTAITDTTAENSWYSDENYTYVGFHTGTAGVGYVVSIDHDTGNMEYNPVPQAHEDTALDQSFDCVNDTINLAVWGDNAEGLDFYTGTLLDNGTITFGSKVNVGTGDFHMGDIGGFDDGTGGLITSDLGANSASNYWYTENNNSDLSGAWNWNNVIIAGNYNTYTYANMGTGVNDNHGALFYQRHTAGGADYNIQFGWQHINFDGTPQVSTSGTFFNNEYDHWETRYPDWIEKNGTMHVFYWYSDDQANSTLPMWHRTNTTNRGTFGSYTRGDTDANLIFANNTGGDSLCVFDYDDDEIGIVTLDTTTDEFDLTKYNVQTNATTTSTLVDVTSYLYSGWTVYETLYEVTDFREGDTQLLLWVQTNGGGTYALMAYEFANGKDDGAGGYYAYNPDTDTTVELVDPTDLSALIDYLGINYEPWWSQNFMEIVSFFALIMVFVNVPIIAYYLKRLNMEMVLLMFIFEIVLIAMVKGWLLM